MLHSSKNVRVETIAVPGTRQLLIEAYIVVWFSELSEDFSLTG